MTLTPDIQLSPAQQLAVEGAKEWYKNWEPEAPPFRIFGYAGTGKTTTVRQLVAALDLDWKRIIFAAYTGKAALVMQKAGLPAQTLHSCLYMYVQPNKDHCNALFAAWEEEADPKKKAAKRAELDEARAPRFELNYTKSPLLECDLLVVDEVSMVNEEMKEDIESFEVPLLVLGDPGQLPPIEGTGALVSGDPDIMLTEIHRQKEGSTILDMSYRARQGVPIQYGYTDEASHVHKKDLDIDDYLDADQVLTGKNDTRRTLNKMLRAAQGRTEHYPVIGDKLICLRNNKDLPLLNGLFAEVTDIGDLSEHYIVLNIETELGHCFPVNALRAHFDVYLKPDALQNVKWWERRDAHEFDYGYAITVHKAQGSQWDNVLLYDDGFLNWKKTERRRWLYTAITRAAEKLTIAD